MKSISFLTPLSSILILTNFAYADCVSGDCNNGTGKFEYADGGVYEGSFKDGWREGHGKYTWAGKDRYEGNWTHGNQDGDGSYFNADGSIEFTGRWQNGQRLAAENAENKNVSDNPDTNNGCISGNCVDGTGVYLLPTGDRYEGSFKDGKRGGPGTYLWKDGSKYTGNWENDRQEGQGSYFLADGTLGYEGLWKSGAESPADSVKASLDEKAVAAGGSNCVSGNCTEGSGRYKYEGFGIYEGQFAGGVRNGHGTFTWDDGTVYTGAWVNDNMTGFGTLSFPDKRKFEGAFDNGNKVAGTFTWPDGSKYIGTFKDNKINGYGTTIYADGSFYVGNFENEMKSGKGSYLNANGGVVYSGTWKDDKAG